MSAFVWGVLRQQPVWQCAGQALILGVCAGLIGSGWLQYILAPVRGRGATVTGKGGTQVAEFVLSCGAHEYSDSVNSFSAWRTDQHTVHEPAAAALLAPEARRSPFGRVEAALSSNHPRVDQEALYSMSITQSLSEP